MKIYFDKNTKILLVCPTHIEKLNLEKIFFFELINNWLVDIISISLEKLNAIYKNSIIINDETLEKMIQNENTDFLIIMKKLYKIFYFLYMEDQKIIKKMIKNAEKKLTKSFILKNEYEEYYFRPLKIDIPKIKLLYTLGKQAKNKICLPINNICGYTYDKKQGSFCYNDRMIYEEEKEMYKILFHPIIESFLKENFTINFNSALKQINQGRDIKMQKKILLMLYPQVIELQEFIKEQLK